MSLNQDRWSSSAMAINEKVNVELDIWQPLVRSYAKSAAIKAVIELRVPTILAQAVDKQQRLTVREIAKQLPSKTVNLGYLDRLLTYASSIELFEVLPSDGTGHFESGGGATGERDPGWRFGLTPFSRTLVEDGNDDGGSISLINVARMFLCGEFVEPWDCLREAVLTGEEPFKIRHKQDSWELAKVNSEFNTTVNRGMADRSKIFMRHILKSYKGFSSVKVLMDVGGGLGSSLADIVKVYPNIQGINFDLPHVVAEAPEIPGVKHVGGDMFKSVPKADAIFMKYILHDWNDEESAKILKSCVESLPSNGKLILAENILPPKQQSSGSHNFLADMSMLVLTSGRKRTAEEWPDLLGRAGFKNVEIFDSSPIAIIEAHKA